MFDVKLKALSVNKMLKRFLNYSPHFPLSAPKSPTLQSFKKTHKTSENQ